MRKFKIKMKKVIPYIIALVLGLLILPLAIKAAFLERGYSAAGGELLLPLLFVLLVAFGSEVKDIIKEFKEVW
jgi:hypothetical protein